MADSQLILGFFGAVRATGTQGGARSCRPIGVRALFQRQAVLSAPIKWNTKNEVLEFLLEKVAQCLGPDDSRGRIGSPLTRRQKSGIMTVLVRRELWRS